MSPFSEQNDNDDRPRSDEGVAGAWLSNEDFVEVTGRMADVVRAGLPLAPGLRALGEEAPSRRLKRALVRISDRLDGGEPIEAVIDASGTRLPPHLQGLIRAGARTNRLAPLLEQYLDDARRALDLRRQTRLALLYPATLIAAAAVIFIIYLWWIVPLFVALYSDFGSEIPGMTDAFIMSSQFLFAWGGWIAAGTVLFGAAVWYGVALIGGWAFRRRLCCMVPLLGSMLRFSALSRFCRLLGLLVENGVTLPEALDLAGRSSGDDELHAACRQMVADMQRGESAEQSASWRLRRFPAAVWQPFRWAERRDAFTAALQGAGEVFEARARLQAGMLPGLLEPCIVVGVALFAFMMMAVLFLPLIQLLNDLS